MRNLIKLLCLFLLANIILSTEQQFQLTCRNFSLRRSVLFAQCKTTAGLFVDTNIDLNRCISNMNGVLTRTANGNFFLTCNHCNLFRKWFLRCRCKRTNNSFFNSDLNLSQFITNINGQLTC
jgi:hypothetical protein